MIVEGMGIVVAVGAVILDNEGRVLLGRHKPERRGFWAGKWICPGGKLMEGETIKDGILREVMEETHLSIELCDPLPPFERIVWDEGSVVLHVIYIDYTARVVGGELEPDSDLGEAIWVSCDELRSIWYELHEDTRILLTNARLCDWMGEA
ncbi:MAG TPA: NUDIX domain-containing protein [Candidatus Syntrophoarchaeum butanivorans]|uniref:NUDIX domain-containing protein n=1 Tax=Candidatus Syntropharchaeum butanivorans TaxID=1839936 RepID=A0A7C1B6D4_9EURY|nr:NUDIX domain-containing protein [Candidatus Syntrophoarchaeum butanivorans]